MMIFELNNSKQMLRNRGKINWTEIFDDWKQMFGLLGRTFA